MAHDVPPPWGELALRSSLPLNSALSKLIAAGTEENEVGWD